MENKKDDALEIGICKDSWNGAVDQAFTWNNQSAVAVILTQYNNTPWPFTALKGSSISPGKSPGQLISTAGTYYYNALPCPQLGNPKTVVISMADPQKR